MNRPFSPTWPPRLAALAATFALVACGGGGDGGGTPMPPGGNADPVAAFSAPDSVVAGSAARFDAAASSDADGDALTYSWEFSSSGSARRGGGMKIAQAFATPGSYTVKLTVADGKGGVASATRTLDVTPGAALNGTVETLIVVRDRSGVPLSAVSVGNVDSGATATTDGDGRASLATPRGIASVLRLSKAGYADHVRTLALPAGAESGYLEATMAPREAALTLADAAAGGALAGKDGASVVFAPGSIVDAAGAPVSGPVQVAITPIDVGADVHSFPGRFEGLRQDGTSTIILSYGTVEFALSAGGQRVQLAPGRTATIEIPSYAGKHVDGTLVKAGDTIPLWSLDETTGAWVEEGSGVVVAAANSPTGFALRASVTHFSWWNADMFVSPPIAPPGRPKPKCMVDSNADGNLEDLTGTGYCWNAGTGPEQPDSIFSAAASRRRAQAGAASTPRIPAWAGDAWIPAAGGVVLPVPAGLDITFRAYAKNGTLFGTKVVNIANDVEVDVPILLEPVAQNPGTLAAALPYDERFVIGAIGEIDRFTFSGEAGANYEILVSRNPSSLLAGGVRVLGGTGAQLASGSFATGAFATVVSAGAGGTMSVEVTATGEAPGSYRVQIRKLLPSSCSAPQAITVPQTLPSAPIGAGATLCFELPLQAGDAIVIAASQLSQTSGVLTLFAPDGSVAVSRGYGAQVGPLRLETGVAVAGTWRVQISNNGGNPGTLSGLAFSRVALDGTLDLGATASHSGSIPPAGRKYLVRPAGAGAVAYKMAVTGGGQSAEVAPMNAFIDAAVTTGRVLAHPTALLPIVTVFAQAGSSFTLGVAAPETIGLDSDVATTSPAQADVRFWQIDGAAGAQWTAGFASTQTSLQMALYGPDGARLSGTGASHLLHTLSTSGIYTVELRTGVGASAPVTVRVNSAAPPEPLVLGALTQRSMTLAIGEVRRFAFDLTRGQLLGLRLATTTGVRAQAQIDGGSIHNGAVALSPPNALSKHSGPLYVQQSAAAILSVYSTGHAPGDAAGAVAVDLEAPTPAPATLGELLTLQLPPSTLVDWRYDIAAAGKHLLCWSYVGAVDSGGNTRVRGIVWGPVARFSNYDGDLGGGGQGTVLEALGDLATGPNTLTLFSDLPAAVPATARLVPIAAPTALAVGASDGGSIAPCQRRYHTFAAVGGQAYTLKVTAAFAGSVRLRKLPPNGDVTARTDPPFSSNNIAGTPLALVSGVEKTVVFTVPNDAPHGSGTYIVEIDGDGDAAGSYSLNLASP